MRIAGALASSGQNPETYILSDGRIGNAAEVETAGGKVFYVKVGRLEENLGITALEVRRKLSRHAQTIRGRRVVGGSQLFVSVTNGGKTRRTATLHIRLRRPGEREPIEYDAAAIEVPGGSITGKEFDFPPDEQGTVEIVLDAPGDPPFDNRAHAILEKEARLRVHLATRGNYFLQRGLSVHPSVQLFVRPGAPDAESNYDVYIWDRVEPPALALSSGRHLYFGLRPPIEGLGGTGEVKPVEILDFDARHPVTRFTSFTKLNVARAHILTLPSFGVPLVDARSTPLVAALERGDSRHLVVGFDIYESDWPTLGASFAIFLRNAILWLGGLEEGRTSRMLRAGDVLVLAQSEELGRPLHVTGPDGTRADLEPGGTTAQYGATELAGVHTVQYSEAVQPYAVNLLSPEEARIGPVEEIRFRDVQMKGTAEPTLQNLDLWWYVAALAFLVLLGEWYIYNRKVYV